jgi:hypothetical protein
MESVMTNITASATGGERLDVAVERMSDLLRRYPEIGEEERLSLIRFLKHGTPEGVARLTFGSGVGPQLTAFKKDHPGEFATGLKVWAPLAIFGLGALTVLLAIHFLLG